MAGLAANEESRLQILVDWDRGNGVLAPELAATWCRLEIRVDGQLVTAVEDRRGGGIRRGINTSAYPLAEWIATRWWSLQAHLRPSAVPSKDWNWSRVRQQKWLRSHNLRGAGDGMAWPNLTVVPEGEVSRLVWFAGVGLANQPLTFLSSGDAFLPSQEVRVGLATFVVQVIDRLTESGIAGTLLQDEWAALRAEDAEEAVLAESLARLGLDPFNVPEEVAEQVETLANTLDRDLLSEFLDSADPSKLSQARNWIERAKSTLSQSTFPETSLLASLGAVQTDSFDGTPPWVRGYALARACRASLGLNAMEHLDLDSLVSLARVSGDSAGLQGLVETRDGCLGLALPESVRARTSTRFAQARALGLGLIAGRATSLIDPVGTDLSKQSRAFAAELIAPAEGISYYLEELATTGERAIESIADKFEVSTLVVQLQQENQLS